MVESQRPVALVTGSARRIGAAIARTLHAAGYDVVLHQRSLTRELRSLVEELEGKREQSTLALPVELADLDAVADMPERCIERFGRLDVLVNNASSYFPTALGAITTVEWDELFAANARAPLFLIQAAAPYLRERHGAILNLLDIHAARPPKGYSVYAMAKSALVTLTEALAVELAPEVRVNGIALGAILWAESGKEDGARQERVLRRTPLGRLGEVQDVADAALYLLRDAHYCTGTILRIDGGRALV